MTGISDFSFAKYSKLGEITRRPRDGIRPTLLRSSVLEFAERWSSGELRERYVRRGRRSAGSDAHPGEEWCGRDEAAQILGMAPGSVFKAVASGRVSDVREMRTGRRRWFYRADLERIVEGRRQWLSTSDVAALAGCSTSTVRRALQSSSLPHRPRVHQTIERPAAEA